MLENEISFGWGLAASVAREIFWRWFILGIGPGIILGGILSSQIGSPWAGLLVQLVISFLGLWISVRWLFGTGRFGSMKLLFMEQADYQKLTSNWPR
jgi:hypothetical protein